MSAVKAARRPLPVGVLALTLLSRFLKLGQIAIAAMVLILGPLYLLVRFIHWAWTN